MGSQRNAAFAPGAAAAAPRRGSTGPDASHTGEGPDLPPADEGGDPPCWAHLLPLDEEHEDGLDVD